MKFCMNMYLHNCPTPENFKVICQRSRSHGFLGVHDAVATRGQYLALIKTWWSCYVRGSDGQYCFHLSFFSVHMITHEPLHLTWQNFARTCSLTTAWYPENFKVIGQGHRNGFLISQHCEIGQQSLWTQWLMNCCSLMKFCMNMYLKNL